VLLDAHFAEVVVLTLLLPLVLHQVLPFLGLALDEIPRLDLSVAVAIQCLILAMVVARLCVCYLVPHSLVLILQLLLEFMQPIITVESCPHHFLLILTDFFLDLKFVVIIDRTMVSPAVTVIFF
jgi:hypothetical protein